MGSLGSISSLFGGGGGGGGPSASTKQSQDFGSDTYNITPGVPPGQKPSWLLPAVIGGVGLLAVAAMVFLKKK